MDGHHLILGELTDVLTGETLQDTHDERYRQQIAILLLEHKGFTSAQLIPRAPLTVSAGPKAGRLSMDLLVKQQNIITMIIKYAPGSIVTRERPVLAMSRLVAPYQVPVAVVTNGEDAHILDGKTGRLIGQGLDEIPDAASLLKKASLPLIEIDKKRLDMESRIVYAYEVDGSCPCDDTICRLPETPES